MAEANARAGRIVVNARADTRGDAGTDAARTPAFRQARMAIALFVAPLLGAAAIFPLIGGAVGCAYPIAYAINVLVGIPVSLRLLARGAPWWHFTIWGALVGAAPFLLFDAWVAVEELWKLSHIPSAANPAVALQWIAAGALCGAVTATALWLLAFRLERR